MAAEPDPLRTDQGPRAISTLSGELCSAELEDAFRRDTWPEWLSRLRQVGSVGALFFLGGTVIDWLLIGPGQQLRLLLMVRITVAAILAAVMTLAARTGRRTRSLDLVILGAVVTVAAATSVIIYLSPGQLLHHALTVLVLLLVFYLFTPVRLVHTAIAGSAFAAAFVALGIVRFDPAANELALVLLYLALINVLGAFGGRMVGATRRQQYLLLHAERQAHDELRAEMNARRRAEEALGESEQRYRSLVELSPYAIMVHRRGALLYTNLAGVRLVGAHSAEDVVGRQILDLVLPEYVEQSRARLQRIEAGADNLPSAEIMVRCLDGRVTHCEVVSGPTVFAGEAAIQTVISDIAERKQLEEELRRLATTDPLTDIFNRRHFFEHLRAEWARASRHRRSISVLMIDVDDFKKVNDQYGHAVGDSALRAVARAFASVVRAEDILARIGGDELVVLLPEDDLGGARTTAERLRRQLAKTRISTPGEPLELTVSIGIAVCDPCQATPDTCLRAADDALYAAKMAGRDTVRIAGEAP